MTSVETTSLAYVAPLLDEKFVSAESVLDSKLISKSQEGCSLGRAEKLPTLFEATNGRTTETCSSCKAVWHVLCVVRYVFSEFGLVSDVKSDAKLLKEFALLHRLHEKRLLMKYLKFKCAISFSHYLRNLPPKLDDDLNSEGVLPTPWWAGGRYHAFQRTMYLRRTNESAQFAYSLLMMKKGFPRPDEDDVKAAEKQALLTMTTPMPQSDRRDIAIDVVGEYVRRIVKQVFRPIDWDNEIPCWWSMSGHYGAKSSEGGALVQLRDAGLAPDPNAITLEKWVNMDREYIEDEESPMYTMTSVAQAELRRVQRNLVAAGLEERSYCKPVGLPEPLKIRMVTVGPVFRYAACGVIQKRIWQQLKTDKHFAIGAPITIPYLQQWLGRLAPGNKWCSGDYKAATDNLSMELSEHIAHQIADATNMPMDYRQLFVEALTGHEYDMGDGTYAPQRRGQLMGSPVSFPVLCIANMALIWASICPEERRLSEVKAVVNGDDCLFQCDEDRYRAWASLAGLIGLETSVGKTYFDASFQVINSVLYRCDLEGTCAEELPYLNLGLLIGMKRSGSDKRKDVLPSRKNGWQVDAGVGGRARAFVKGWADAASKLGTFIGMNREMLEQDGCRPWFVPEEFGGFGLPEVGHERYSLPSLEDMYCVIGSDEPVSRGEKQARIPKPKVVCDLNSPFYAEIRRDLINQFGSHWTAKKGYNVGAYQWKVMKTAFVEKVPRWLAEKRSMSASHSVQDFWARAYKLKQKGVDVVRRRLAECGMTDELSPWAAARAVYNGIVERGPWTETPNVEIRQDFLDVWATEMAEVNLLEGGLLAALRAQHGWFQAHRDLDDPMW